MKNKNLVAKYALSVLIAMLVAFTGQADAANKKNHRNAKKAVASAPKKAKAKNKIKAKSKKAESKQKKNGKGKKKKK